jgi:rRNA-processing protein FCF1
LVELTVIVDTSFLMIPGMFGVDVISELDRLLQRSYSLVIPKPVLEELRILAKRGKPRERAAARLGIALVKRGKVVNVEGSADEMILTMAHQNCVVGTTDATLRRKLRRKGVPVTYLREKSHLALDGLVG